MKRKSITISTLCLTVIACMAFFTACGETHTHNYTESVVVPTCTEQGYTTFTCSCGDKYVGNYVKAKGHDFTDYVSDDNATCTKDGTKTAHCNSEGCTETDTVADVGSAHHTPKTAVRENVVEPTKTEDGGYDEVVYCAVCTEEISRNHITVKRAVMGTEICSKTLSVDLDNKTLSGRLPSGTDVFCFPDDITVADGAKFSLCTDITGQNVIPTKIATLNTGDNVYYLLVENGNEIKTYTVTLYVKSTYTVSFNTNGGGSVVSQTVEENAFATQPTTVMKAGYTFDGWDFDFTTPITEDTTITAKWTVNTDT